MKGVASGADTLPLLASQRRGRRKRWHSSLARAIVMMLKKYSRCRIRSKSCIPLLLDPDTYPRVLILYAASCATPHIRESSDRWFVFMHHEVQAIGGYIYKCMAGMAGMAEEAVALSDDIDWNVGQRYCCRARMCCLMKAPVVWVGVKKDGG